MIICEQLTRDIVQTYNFIHELRAEDYLVEDGHRSADEPSISTLRANR